MPEPGEPREGAEPAAAPDVADAIRALGKEVEAYTGDLVNRVARPDILLHFTDSAGLIGILKGRKLWASLATALNDASETTVALDLLAFAGAMAIVRSHHMHYDFLEKVFKGEVTLPGHNQPTDYRTYVTSLCETDAAVHWMQYGRGGTGVALEFDTAALSSLGQFRLCKVIYDTDEQFACLRELVNIVDRFLDRCVPHIASSEQEELIKIAAAGLLHSFIKMTAPQMKDIAFSAEDEWRLFSTEGWVQPENVNERTRTTEFRSAGNRIVPYKEVPVPIDSIKAIRLGYSCSIRADEQALRVLMDECLNRQVPVTRSLIAVRP
jgi:hypothetical protein